MSFSLPPSPAAASPVRGIKELARESAGRFRMNKSSLQHFERQGISTQVGLKYVAHGVEHYHLNGTSQPVSAGQFLIVQPGSEVSVKVKGRQTVQGMCLYLAPEDLGAALAAYRSPADWDTEAAAPHCSFPEQVFPVERYALGQWLASLYALPNERLDADELRLSLASMLAPHVRQTRAECGRISALRSSTRAELYRRLLRGQSYMHAHLAAPLSVAQIACEAGVSEFHFFRAFRQAFGKTPHQYLTHIRLERACELLQSEPHSVAAVAQRTGFADSSHFGKVFRRTYGLSPRKWVEQQEK